MKMKRTSSRTRIACDQPDSRPRFQLTLALLAGLIVVCGGRAAHAQIPGTPDSSPPIGIGQQNGPVNRGPIQRVADGEVHNKADALVSGAVVYLKNSKTLEVKTFITDATGKFHFGQLGQNIDYELWAEFDGSRSKSKSISSFDSKNNYNFTLKIDLPKATAANSPPPT